LTNESKKAKKAKSYDKNPQEKKWGEYKGGVWQPAPEFTKTLSDLEKYKKACDLQELQDKHHENWIKYREKANRSLRLKDQARMEKEKYLKS